LAGTTVTNVPPTTINGDLGLSPGSAVTGAPTVNGATNIDNPAAVQAKSDLTTAYTDAANRTPSTVLASPALAGLTLPPGLYSSAVGLTLSGTVTLNGGGDANAVFIFQTAGSSTLLTASSSSVVLENGAQACNVFWQVASSATLGSNTSFVGTILASTSAVLDSGATVVGRVLAGTGEVTLDDNTITVPTCNASATPTPTTSPTTSPTPITTTGAGGPSVPVTGAVGTTHFGAGILLALGGLALLGAGMAMGAIRRRRLPSTR
jgi:type VI secretion system secreted protein VgrG